MFLIKIKEWFVRTKTTIISFIMKKRDQYRSRTSDNDGIPKKPLWQRLKSVFFVGFLLLATGFIAGTIIMIKISGQLPDPNRLTNRSVAQSTKIYDASGQHLLHEFFEDQKRTLVKLEDVSPFVPKAVVAIEDKYFEDHKGVRIWSILRAGFNNMIGKRAGGGGASTLTQQLIKNVLVGNERTFFRKIKEALLAIKAEQQYSKKEIMQMYLNEVPFGSTNYGVESASQSYFQKSARDLNLPEAATLAAIIQRPSGYLNNLEALKERRNLVLRLMFEQGYISEEEKTNSQSSPLTLTRGKGVLEAPHFVFYVQDELQSILGQQEVDKGGYKVFTTLDYDKQMSAEKIVKENGDKFAKENNANNAALVAIEPKTGKIVSMVGSRDYFNDEIDGQFNVVLSKNRQPGSSFKPFVYLAAFEKGFTPTTMLYDIRVDFDQRSGSKFSPHNANFQEYGQITMQKALQGSLNIPAVKTMYLIGGLKPTIDFAKRFGYTTLDPEGNYGLSLVIGGAAIMPLEHTAAYAALANNGIYIPPYSILKIEDANGKVVFERKEVEGSQAVSPELAATMSNILTNNPLRAFIFGSKNNLTLPDRPAAVKTGTTNDNKDAWTMGYVPSLSVGVWVGNTKPAPMIGGGERLAGIIWNQFMRTALKDTKPELFPPAPANASTKPIFNGTDGGIKLKINSANGKIATSSTPPQFIIEKTFILPHDILFYVDKEDPAGPEPLNPQDDPQYQNWEKALQAWIQKKQEKGEIFSLDPPPTEYDDTGSSSPDGSVRLEILSPSAQQIIDNTILDIRINAFADRGISQASFQIDNLNIGTSKEAPFSMSFNTASLSKGEHILRVTVVDDVGNWATKEVVFSINNASVTANFEWFDLSPLALSSTDFPRSMFLNVEKWEDVKEIKVYLIGPTNEKRLVYTFDKNDVPINNKLSFSWKRVPAPGAYSLHGVMTTNNGKTTEKDLKIELR